MTDYDGIIIGAGQAGGPLSTALAQAGWQVAVVEREHAGGTCINEGCTPTKLMAATARVAYLAGRSEEYGIHTGDVTVDMRRIRERKRDIVQSWREGSRQSITSAEGVTYIDGEARFLNAHTLEVALKDGGTRQLSGEHIFINTGQRPRRLPIDGLDEVETLTNKSIMELAEVPDHLIVIGGGYIGLEFGQMFRRFGAEVTMLEAGEQFLHREDRDIAQAVRDILIEDGIMIYTNAQARHVSQHDGAIKVVAHHNDGELSVEGSHLLLAVGRTPNTDMLNVEAAGIETDERGYIRTNSKLQTNVPHIYALGDVKGGPAFTHISYDDFRIIRTNLIEGGEASIDERLVPYTMFIDPQLAHVGLHEHEARDQNLSYHVATLPMDHVARAIEMNETRGMMKAIVDAETGQILGATILGVAGGEVMSVLQMAMMGNIPYTTIRDSVFAHPLLAESLNNLFSGVGE